MNLQEIKSDIPIQCEKNLSALYESICDEYRRRLCEMWGFDFKDSYWIPDNRIGEVVAICDGEYTFGMEDLRYFVENDTSYEDFSEWWRYNLVNPKRQINAYSWFALGARPEILTK